jgi:hypothetical protein
MAWIINATLGDTSAVDQKLATERARLQSLKGDEKLPADVQTVEEAQLVQAAQLVRYVTTLLGPRYAGGTMTLRGSGLKGRGISGSVQPLGK